MEKVVGPNKVPAKHQDVIPLLFYLAQVLFVIVMAIKFMSTANIKLPGWIKGTRDELGVSDEQIIQLGFTSAGLSFAGSLGIVVIWLSLLFLNAYCMIILGQIFLAIMLVVSGILFVAAAQVTPALAAMYWIGAILCFAGAAMVIAWIFCIRDRIEFTAMLLKTITFVPPKGEEELLDNETRENIIERVMKDCTRRRAHVGRARPTLSSHSLTTTTAHTLTHPRNAQATLMATTASRTPSSRRCCCACPTSGQTSRCTLCRRGERRME